MQHKDSPLNKFRIFSESPFSSLIVISVVFNGNGDIEMGDSIFRTFFTFCYYFPFEYCWKNSFK